jgi:ribosome-binding factor A
MASEAKTRPARVEAEIRQELARLISRDLGDPRLEALVVANVTMTGDLRMAKIFWRLAILDEPGPLLDARRKDTQTALERAAGRLKRAITGRLKLRVVPELKFEYDAGQEKRDRIDQLLEEVKKDERAPD